MSISRTRGPSNTTLWSTGGSVPSEAMAQVQTTQGQDQPQILTTTGKALGTDIIVARDSQPPLIRQDGRYYDERRPRQPEKAGWFARFIAWLTFS